MFSNIFMAELENFFFRLMDYDNIGFLYGS